ncbi:MAG: tetraacyldisaccharide 4'-kinase, partial [Lysobacterales bacterium]
VVGNITAGGSGKTPLVIRLCEIATEMGISAGVATTGYGRQSTETLVVGADSDPRDCGDEPVLLAERTGLPVVVARRRAEAVVKLQEMSLDLIISDDGLQHADLDPDIEICVIDGARGLGNGHLIPAGPLREPAGRIGQVDYVITNGVWSEQPEDLVVSIMQLWADKVCSLDNKTVISAEEFRQTYSGIKIHAIAGIGNPLRFFQTLDDQGIAAGSHVFPDHHFFSPDDFCSIPAGAAIIMTQKDAVKCRSLGLANAWYLPVDAKLPAVFETRFKDQLVKLMEKASVPSRK